MAYTFTFVKSKIRKNKEHKKIIYTLNLYLHNMKTTTEIIKHFLKIYYLDLATDGKIWRYRLSQLPGADTAVRWSSPPARWLAGGVAR